MFPYIDHKELNPPSFPLALSTPSASLSPDIVETSEPAVVGVSQLEGSPMDTSSPASATQEEAAATQPQTAQLSQELSVSGESGLTDRQTDADTGLVTQKLQFYFCAWLMPVYAT